MLFSRPVKENQPQDPIISQNNQLTAKVDGASFQSKEIAAVSNPNSGSFLITAKDDHDNSVTITGPASVGTFGSASNSATSGFYTSNDGDYGSLPLAVALQHLPLPNTMLLSKKSQAAFRLPLRLLVVRLQREPKPSPMAVLRMLVFCCNNWLNGPYAQMMSSCLCRGFCFLGPKVDGPSVEERLSDVAGSDAGE